MSRMIFVNLPVSDLEKSIVFYEGIGGTKNPQFSDETAACIVISETIFVMLLTHPKFSSFTSKKIIDAHKDVQALLALNADTKEAVDEMVNKAKAAGGKLDPTPTQDMGFMYGRSFEDPDGHIWEVFWMDPAAVNGG